MLTPIHLRDLRVNASLHPRGQAHISAASGLARVHDLLYLVADDEQHLGLVDERAAPEVPVQLLPLLDQALPRDPAQRKALKPDFESLVLLPALPGCPHGALLALGSGSGANRQQALLLALDSEGKLTQRRAAVDLAPLYRPLRNQFPDLNIEGAFVATGELRLLQRGNRGDARNACICFDWNQLAPWLAGRRTAPPAAKSVQAIALPSVDGVPLGLTDGAALPGGCWLFSAVAEDTGNSFQDGVCKGSVLGVVAPDGQVRHVWRLQGGPKVEGISVLLQGDAMEVTMVTDADNPAIASALLQVAVSLAPGPGTAA